MNAFLYFWLSICGIFFQGNCLPYRELSSKYDVSNDNQEDIRFAFGPNLPNVLNEPQNIEDILTDRLSWLPPNGLRKRWNSFDHPKPQSKRKSQACDNCGDSESVPECEFSKAARMKQKIKMKLRNFSNNYNVPKTWSSIKSHSAESMCKVKTYIKNKRIKEKLKNITHPLRYKGPKCKTQTSGNQNYMPSNLHIHPKSSHVEKIHSFTTTEAPTDNNFGSSRDIVFQNFPPMVQLPQLQIYSVPKSPETPANSLDFSGASQRENIKQPVMQPLPQSQQPQQPDDSSRNIDYSRIPNIWPIFNQPTKSAPASSGVPAPPEPESPPQSPQESQNSKPSSPEEYPSSPDFSSLPKDLLSLSQNLLHPPKNLKPEVEGSQPQQPAQSLEPPKILPLSNQLPSPSGEPYLSQNRPLGTNEQPQTPVLESQDSPSGPQTLFGANGKSSNIPGLPENSEPLGSAAPTISQLLKPVPLPPELQKPIEPLPDQQQREQQYEPLPPSDQQQQQQHYEPLPSSDQQQQQQPYEPLPLLDQQQQQQPYEPLPSSDQQQQQQPYEPLPSSDQQQHEQPYESLPSPDDQHEPYESLPSSDQQNEQPYEPLPPPNEQREQPYDSLPPPDQQNEQPYEHLPPLDEQREQPYEPLPPPGQQQHEQPYESLSLPNQQQPQQSYESLLQLNQKQHEEPYEPLSSTYQQHEQSYESLPPPDQQQSEQPYEPLSFPDQQNQQYEPQSDQKQHEQPYDPLSLPEGFPDSLKPLLMMQNFKPLAKALSRHHKPIYGLSMSMAPFPRGSKLYSSSSSIPFPFVSQRSYVKSPPSSVFLQFSDQVFTKPLHFLVPYQTQSDSFDSYFRQSPKSVDSTAYMLLPDAPHSQLYSPKKIKLIINFNNPAEKSKFERNVDPDSYLASLEGDNTNSTHVLETAGEMASDLAGRVTNLWHCVLGSHRVPDTRDVRFFLYTRRNVVQPELLNVNYDLINKRVQAKPERYDIDCVDVSPDQIEDFQRISDENRKIIKSNHLNIRAPTKILIHGYTGSYKDSRMAKIKDAYLSKGRYNVIQVDWEVLAAPPCYIRVTHHSKFVGETIAQLLNGLYMVGLNMSLVHLIGFSLGAQVAGFTGNNSTVVPVCRITGLDPALPLFLHTQPSGHLDKLDAKFVDVIHTCGGILAMLDPLGHVDFYPNGGTRQPGCEFSNLKCSHSRAPQYFAESVNSVKKFTGQLCLTWEEFVAGDCKNTSAFMGDPCSRKSTFGKYYLLTKSKEPFVL